MKYSAYRPAWQEKCLWGTKKFLSTTFFIIIISYRAKKEEKKKYIIEQVSISELSHTKMDPWKNSRRGRFLRDIHHVRTGSFVRPTTPTHTPTGGGICV